CLAIEVSHSLPAVRVIEVLERLRSERGLPDVIVTDNGTDLTSRAFDAWAYARGVKIDFIQPGKPVQNCFVESFNGTFRDDCLNLHWFTSLAAAKVQIESWRREYNTERPHSSLKRLTPAKFAELPSERWPGVGPNHQPGCQVISGAALGVSSTCVETQYYYNGCHGSYCYSDREMCCIT